MRPRRPICFARVSRRLVSAGLECTHALVLAVYPQFGLEGVEEETGGNGTSEVAARLLIQRAA